jgi:hypothetical protein
MTWTSDENIYIYIYIYIYKEASDASKGIGSKMTYKQR